MWRSEFPLLELEYKVRIFSKINIANFDLNLIKVILKLNRLECNQEELLACEKIVIKMKDESQFV